MKKCRLCNIILKVGKNIVQSAINHCDYICTTCNSIKKKEWCNKNPEKTKISCRLRMRKWRSNPENNKKEAKRNKEYYPKYIKRVIEYNKQYIKDNKDKINARSAVNYAIKTGKLKKLPCEECGNKKSTAHHDNYKDKLNVRWLCYLHHNRLHKLIST